MAQLLAIEISPESRPALRVDLAAALRMASLVMDFPLDDHAAQGLPGRAAGPRGGAGRLVRSRLAGVLGGGVIKGERVEPRSSTSPRHAEMARS